MRAQFVLSEIGIGLRRNLTMTIAVVLTTTIALALLGASLLMNKQVQTMKGYWYDKVEVSLFLCVAKGDQCPAKTTDAQRKQLEGELKADPLVKEVFYESQADAYARFKVQFKDQPDIVRNVTIDAIQDSFRVKLKNAKQSDILVSEFQAKPGVDQVQDARKLLGNFFEVLAVVSRVMIIIATLAIVAAVLLISNTIRVAAFNRRRETGIMRLVGASNFYIQLPFLLEGALAGFVGAVAAWGMLALFQALVIDGLLRAKIPAVRFIGWDAVWSVAPVLILIGIALSAAASFFTLRRYLKV